MYHVELRKFPHLARVFNLTEDELRTRIVVPWVRSGSVELDERRWTSDKARLTIYEGSAIAAEDRGLGRGWSTVTREGQEVTARVLREASELVPRTSELKQKLLDAAPIALSDAVALGGAGHPGWRPSELLAVAEQAVWELLHEGRLALVRAETPVPAAEWEPLLLSWASWVEQPEPLQVRPI